MLNIFHHSGPVFCVSSLLHDGKMLAVSSGKSTSVSVWKIDDCTEVRAIESGHNSHINTINISYSSNPLICTGSYDGTVRLHGDDLHERYPPMNHGNAVFAVKIVESENCIITCGQYGKINIFDLTDSSLLR